jgi:hypothetical protein
VPQRPQVHTVSSFLRQIGAFIDEPLTIPQFVSLWFHSYIIIHYIGIKPSFLFIDEKENSGNLYLSDCLMKQPDGYSGEIFQ